MLDRRVREIQPKFFESLRSCTACRSCSIISSCHCFVISLNSSCISSYGLFCKINHTFTFSVRTADVKRQLPVDIEEEIIIPIEFKPDRNTLS